MNTAKEVMEFVLGADLHEAFIALAPRCDVVAGSAYDGPFWAGYIRYPDGCVLLVEDFHGDLSIDRVSVDEAEAVVSEARAALNDPALAV